MTSERSYDGGAPLSPALAHYKALKEERPECLLFYQMGDFYELFFEDAETAAGALDIALTARGKQGGGGEAPMCGVPMRAADTYIARLIRKGFKVALCDQMEDPAEAKKRGAKTVRREVVRVITPGTLTEDALLDGRANNHLCAVGATGGALAVAWADLSTGAFAVQPSAPDRLASDLARIDPVEIVLPERLAQDPALFELWGDRRDRLTILPDSRFDSRAAERRLKDVYGVADLAGFGAFDRAEISAAGALWDYAASTQPAGAPLGEARRAARPGRPPGRAGTDREAPHRLGRRRRAGARRAGRAVGAPDGGGGGAGRSRRIG